MSSSDSTRPVRVRFAPSPTGKLHVGGARTAIYNWAFARANHGTFILRIDDTDPTRSTEENTQVILRAMRWLGLDWDEGPLVGGDFGPYKQTDRLSIYREAAERLWAEGKAYPCFCTPEKLAEDKRAAQERHDPFQGYQRRCRDIDPAEAQRRVDAGEPHPIRIKVPLDRGDDHLSNTPRQIMVYEALGAPVPTFAHISMILGPDGKKLSKRHGATSVEEYRDAGYLSDAFVNYLALLGWALDGDTTIVPRDVLASSFSLDHVSKNPATFDTKKHDWIQQRYVQAMSDEEFVFEVLMPELVEAGLEREADPAHRKSWYLLLASVLKPRTTLTHDVVEKARFLYEGDEVAFDEKSVRKNLAKEGAAEALEAAREALSAVEPWEHAAIDAALEPVPERLGTNKRKFFGALRVAECGNQVSPPLGESLELLGRATALARIERALPLAQAPEA